MSKGGLGWQAEWREYEKSKKRIDDIGNVGGISWVQPVRFAEIEAGREGNWRGDAEDSYGCCRSGSQDRSGGCGQSEGRGARRCRCHKKSGSGKFRENKRGRG